MRPDSPFYKSALTVEVGPIDDGDFKEFIADKFMAGTRKIADGFLDAVLECANRTTGDVQELCDSIWCTGDEGETLDEFAIKRGMEQQDVLIVSLSHDRIGNPRVYDGTFLEMNATNGVVSYSRRRPRNGVGRPDDMGWLCAERPILV